MSGNRHPVATLVVNPSAGHGKARRLLPKVTAELVKGLPQYNLRVQQADDFTDAKVRALAAVANGAPAPDDTPDLLLMMGGDGMASIGANAAANSPVRLGVIPAGTGNDFCRGMGLPATTMEAVSGIIRGHAKQVDLLEVTGALTGQASRRFVGSVVSTGYDAKVNYRTNHHRMTLGSLTYGYDALAELAHFEALNYRLVIDGEVRDEPAMLVAVGNAGYIGGGMKICPDADPADGLIDVTIVHPVSRMTLIRLLPSLYTGGFVKDPAVELLRARHVRVDGDDMYAMADGEELGAVPLEIGIAPGALWLTGIQ